jgi:hypothetical protein
MGTEFLTKLIVFVSGAIVLGALAWQYIMKPMHEMQRYRVRRDEMKKRFREIFCFDEPSDDAVSLNMGGIGEKRQKLVAEEVERVVNLFHEEKAERFNVRFNFEQTKGSEVSGVEARLKKHEELLIAEREARRRYSEALEVAHYFGYMRAEVTDIRAADKVA